MKTVYIYTLNCPDTGKVMYVGQSVNPQKRFQQHLYQPKYRGNHKGGKVPWIRSLLDSGKVPLLNVIETSDTERSSDREEFWIKHFMSDNPELTNCRSSKMVHATYSPNYVSEKTKVMERRKLESHKVEPIKEPSPYTFTVKFSAQPSLNKLELMLQKRFSIKELAEKMNMNHRTVNNIFFGDLQLIETKTLERVLDFFFSYGMKISLDDLFRVSKVLKEPSAQ